MIINTSQKGIFEDSPKHVAFAINTDGYDNAGLGKLILENVWPDLYKNENFEIGDVKSKEIENIIFHAMVTYSLDKELEDNHGIIIKECLDKIKTEGAPIHVGAIGTSFVGKSKGVNFNNVICGMMDSDKNIILHANYSLDDIDKIYKEEICKRTGRHK